MRHLNQHWPFVQLSHAVASNSIRGEQHAAFRIVLMPHNRFHGPCRTLLPAFLTFSLRIATGIASGFQLAEFRAQLGFDLCSLASVMIAVVFL
jgi:hypothetical protein